MEARPTGGTCLEEGRSGFGVASSEGKSTGRLARLQAGTKKILAACV
jgi:hypothetical protein